ncbi:MAG: 4Fe-4S binding protein [Deltaproteobacteria bacterium]|nr:4Fe-4S binding protein [Deltaproteobacteria bacterium]
MELVLDPLKCIECGACELACGYHWDRALSPVTSSIMVYRAREKKNYFGLILKQPEHLVLGRPEGIETQRIGAVTEGREADASAKPIMLREACDLCEGFDQGPLCVLFCPTAAITAA